MRRREQTESSAFPKRLATYKPSEWDGRDAAENYGAWMQARTDWADKRGIIGLPGDDEAWAAYPDGDFRLDEL